MLPAWRCAMAEEQCWFISKNQKVAVHSRRVRSSNLPRTENNGRHDYVPCWRGTESGLRLIRVSVHYPGYTAHHRCVEDSRPSASESWPPSAHLSLAAASAASHHSRSNQPSSALRESVPKQTSPTPANRARRRIVMCRNVLFLRVSALQVTSYFSHRRPTQSTSLLKWNHP